MNPLPLDIRIFEWIDHNGWAYWLFAWLVLSLVVAAALAPLLDPPEAAPRCRPTSFRLFRSGPLFAIAVLLVFCAFRWPLWFAGQQDNPDEAEWIAGALTLRDGGLPWKSIDCHTSGPLNAAALLLTIPLGLPLDYVGVRVLASLMQAVSALALWRAARRFAPEWAARLAVLIPVNLWACRWFHDIGQYSSEQTSVLLLALAGWAGAVALTTPRPRLRLALYAAAGCLATLPLFAKPQSLLLSVLLMLLLLGGILIQPAEPEHTAQPTKQKRWLQVGSLAIGALFPLAAFFGYIWVYGLVEQVRIFYWESNFLYATNERSYALSDSPETFFDLINPIRGFTSAMLGALGFGLLVLLPVCTTGRTARQRLIAAWLLVGTAFITVIGPGRIFRHYVHYLVLPLAWLSTVSLAGAHDYLRQTLPGIRHLRPGLVAAFVLLTSVWPIWQTSNICPPMNGQLYFWRQRQVSAVGMSLRQHLAPGDKLVVWGWAPGYHVETGLAQGSREAHCGLIINPGPLQADYRHRFLFDLRRNHPRWFVDAVAPGQFGFQERSLFGHDTWPDLRDFIAAHYDLLDEVDAVRIYRCRD
jgi:hypothetical protein